MTREEAWKRDMAQMRAEDQATLVAAIRGGAIPVDEARCPVCAATLKWSCGDLVGWADCQDGRKVSRRWPGTAPMPCDWAGTRIVRLNNDVFATLPISTRRSPPIEGDLVTAIRAARERLRASREGAPPSIPARASVHDDLVGRGLANATDVPGTPFPDDCQETTR